MKRKNDFMAKDPICGMDVNESTGIKLVKDGSSYYFCSKHCAEKFAKENKIADSELNASLVSKKTRWYKNKVILASGVLALLCAMSYILPFLEPFRISLSMYLGRIWWAVLLGLALGGVIDHFVPREYISHILSKPKKRTIFYSVILGFFMSACSHGILALSIQLHKKGASNPAVVAFLLASPWANLPLTIMLLAFFGPKALFIIFGAIIIAITTGLIFQVLESKGMIETNKNTQVVHGEFSITGDFKKRISSYRFSGRQLTEDTKGVFSGTLSLANMVLWWILIGMGLASLVAAYVPQNFFHHYMGPTFVGMAVTLVIATIMEVCSEGTAPLAFEIYRQTGAFGNAFVFLMAGVVTDYTEIGLLYFNVGKRVAIWLPIITVPQVIALGFLANMIL
ncbi:MAG: permease [Candidatus Omnitrophica bacterium]|nr:permease [Candidatus Omnitrophota bacterium]